MAIGARAYYHDMSYFYLHAVVSSCVDIATQKVNSYM